MFIAHKFLKSGKGDACSVLLEQTKLTAAIQSLCTVYTGTV